MSLGRGQYRVVDVLPEAPEIRERFEGRPFSLHELEQRGVRIAGGQVWYTAYGQDWRLVLSPELEAND
jgi:hypothetical protein